MITTSTIETPNAKRYLGQFCKHFAHKLPVDLADSNEDGLVTFGPGSCALEAGATTLTLTLASQNADEMARLQDVTARHLIRFAFREALEITWRDAA